MSTALSTLSDALLWMTPLLLLIVRFFFPRRFPWWLIVVLTAGLGWLWVEAEEALRVGVELDEVAECRATAVNDPPPGHDCVRGIYHYYSWPIYLKWFPSTVWLAVFLPFYGATYWLVQRLHALPPNKSLERTREG